MQEDFTKASGDARTLGPEDKRLEEALQMALKELSENARDAGFYKGLLEGMLLLIEHETPSEDLLERVRGILRNHEAATPSRLSAH